MASNAVEMLQELEDRFILGEILESDYKQLKWKLLKQLRDAGETLPQVTGSVQRAEVVDSLGQAFCYVPAEPFMYGPDNVFSEVKAPYYMAKYPVTVEQFMNFLEDTGWDYPDEDLEHMHLVSPDPQCPVSHVSWEDAKEYCRWLRRISKEYYSLPHEFEWEKAARGIDGRYYPWGNEDVTPDRACYQGETERECTVPVGSFPDNRSIYGCLDMVGNLWEWTLDTIDDRRDPHVLRGGSWCNTSEYANCISRTFSFPSGKRVDYGGFRVVFLPHDMLIEYRKQYSEGDAVPPTALKVIRLDPVAEKKRRQKTAAAAPEGTAALAKALEAALSRAAGKQIDRIAELSAEVDEAIDSTVRETHDAAGPPVETVMSPTERVPPIAPRPTPPTRPRPHPASTVIQPIEQVAPSPPPGAPTTSSDESHEPSLQEQLAAEISNASQQYVTKRRKDRGPAPQRPKRAARPGTTTGAAKAGTGPLVEVVESRFPTLQEMEEAEGSDLLAAAPAKERKTGPTGAALAAFSLWCLLLVTVIGMFVWRLAVG